MPRQGPGFKPPARPRWVVAAVLGLHLLVLWGLQAATQRPTPTTPSATRALQVTWLTEARVVPATAAGQASPAAVPRHARSAKARVAPPSPPRLAPSQDPADLASPPDGSAAQAPPPEADQPVAAAPPASAPLLDSAASRRAIRELARQRPITEQAALASDTTPPAPGARLGERIREAGKGDCAKGEYFGGGMGLLSLPFLAAAALRDACAQ